jgi:hypothetical protein
MALYKRWNYLRRGFSAARSKDKERKRVERERFAMAAITPNRPRPCGEDTDCLLRLRKGFAGQKVLSRSQARCDSPFAMKLATWLRHTSKLRSQRVLTVIFS